MQTLSKPALCPGRSLSKFLTVKTSWPRWRAVRAVLSRIRGRDPEEMVHSSSQHVPNSVLHLLPWPELLPSVLVKGYARNWQLCQALSCDFGPYGHPVTHVSDSCSGCNKLPPTGWLKITNYPLQVLQVRSLKLRCHYSCVPSKDCRGESLASSSLWWLQGFSGLWPHCCNFCLPGPILLLVTSSSSSSLCQIPLSPLTDSCKDMSLDYSPHG